MAENLNDLRAFVVVGRMGSFTKAAAHIGVSQSALSYTIRTLESRVGLKLLNRTTRSVSLTQAGEQLMQRIEPLMDEIDLTMSELNHFRDTPKGLLRINATDYVISWLLWDKLSKFSHQYPDIVLELTSDYSVTDIVRERYDVGIRLGNSVDKDMVAIPVTSNLQMVLVASPNYLNKCGIPDTIEQLDKYRCIAMRLPTNQNIMSWEFQKSNDNGERQTLTYRPEPAMITSHAHLLVKACLSSLGFVWVPRAMVDHELEQGDLIEVLDKHSIQYERYYMYYPSRNASPLLRLLVDALKLT